LVGAQRADGRNARTPKYKPLIDAGAVCILGVCALWQAAFGGPNRTALSSCDLRDLRDLCGLKKNELRSPLFLRFSCKTVSSLTSVPSASYILTR